jgi:hypothetical protein
MAKALEPLKRGPGRPVAFPLTAKQEDQVRRLLAELKTVPAIMAITGFPETAVRRVQRALR